MRPSQVPLLLSGLLGLSAIALVCLSIADSHGALPELGVFAYGPHLELLFLLAILVWAANAMSIPWLALRPFAVLAGMVAAAGLASEVFRRDVPAALSPLVWLSVIALSMGAFLIRTSSQDSAA